MLFYITDIQNAYNSIENRWIKMRSGTGRFINTRYYKLHNGSGKGLIAKYSNIYSLTLL